MAIFAIDLDGTIWKEEYPGIGEIFDEAVKTIKEIKLLGHTIILWSCREGKLLQEALEVINKYNIPYDFVNENIPERIKFYNSDCRKIGADFIVDDRNIGKWTWNDVLEIARRVAV
jgi:hydroxymethylpyrimidine pyrophosphatase-like HAD family hydrolase